MPYTMKFCASCAKTKANADCTFNKANADYIAGYLFEYDLDGVNA